MKATHSVGYLRFLISLAALGLLAALLLLPNQAQAAVTTIEGDDSASVPENTATSTILVTYTAPGTENDTLTWSLEGDDLGDFTIDAGELKFASVPNFESAADHNGNNVYNVTVKVSDGSLMATLPVTVTVTNADDPGTVMIEGELLGGSTLTASVTDVDGTPTSVTWQWARGESSGGTFDDIGGATSATYTTVAVDVGDYLQATASYTDPQGSDKDANAVTGPIGAGNSEPTLNTTAVTRSFPENSAPGVSVGSPFTATDSDNDPLTYGLIGTDAGSFTIDTSNGQIKTKTGVTYNYESKMSYTVKVTVTDSKDAAGEADTVVDVEFLFTINLTNVDETGTASITGMSSGGSTLMANLSDPDGSISNQSYQWNRSPSAGGTFNNISPNGTGSTYVLVAMDVGQYLKVTVSYTDEHGSGKSATSNATGQIGAGNSEPTFSSATATRTLPENSVAGVNVVGGTITATENGNGDTLTYGLQSGGDSGSFTIVPASGQIQAKSGITYNFEATKKSYTVTVTVRDSKDSAGNANTTTDDTIVVTINLTNVNEAPVITTSATTASVLENSTAVLTFSATDVDMPTTLSWSVESGNDGGKFNINSTSGVLTFKTAPDFESPTDTAPQNSYVVTVKVTDNGSPTMLSDMHTITVNVTNVNEAPVITTSATTASVLENSTAVLTFSATDVDASTTLTWAVESGNDGGKFNINSTSGVLTFKTAPDFESPTDVGDTAMNNTYVVTVKVQDNGSTRMSDTHTVTVNVTNVNEAPVITTSATTASVLENSTAVLTFSATDVDMPTTLSWSVESGNDGGKFNINSTSGVLTFKTAPDFESPTDTAPTNSYVVTVKVTDNGSPTMLSDMHTITVNVTNVNEAPVITTSATTASVPENGTGTVVDFAASDVDASTTLSWSVDSADDGGKFNISSSGGVLTFNTAPDFETPTDTGDTAGDNIYVVTVKVTDNGTPTEEDLHTLRVTVTNVNEAPVITTDSGTFTAFTKVENTETTVVIKTYMATDVDADTTLTWSLEGDDAGDFSITKNTQGHGELKFASVPNFEMAADADDMNDYDITVKVKDDGIPSNRDASNQLDDIVSVTVDVEDVNETPVVSGDATPSFAEIEFDATSADLTIGTYTYTDEDRNPSDTITWDLSGADETHFDIVSTTGVLSFKMRPDFENPFGADNVYVFVVEADDGQGGVGTFNVTVTVTNVDETPEITTQAATHTDPSFAEIEYDATTAVLTVADYDERDEEGQTITWSRGGTDMDDFTIDPISGVLSFAQRPDFEMPVDGTTPPDNVYEIIVKATDTASPANTRELVVTVTVTDVNERPDINEDTVPEYMEIEYDFTGTRPDVHTFSATDYDAGDTFEWTLLDADAGYLDIDPISGVLTFTQDSGLNVGPLPNFEAPRDDNVEGSNTYSITVRATDNHGKFEDYAVVVTVTDVNEVPQFTGTPETAITLGEHDANETYTTPTVADYDASDEEGGVTWSLTGTDSGDFAIDGNGVVTFKAGPSWEDPDDSDDNNVYTFTVVATDVESGTNRLTDSVAVTVTVADLEEQGVITGDNYNPGVGDTIIFTLTDPDGGIVTGLYPDGFEWQIESRVSENAAWQQLLTIPINNSSVQYRYEVEEEDTGNQLRAVVASYQDRRGSGKLAESEPTTAVTMDPIANAPPRFLGPGPQFVPEGPAGQNVGDPPEVSDREDDTLTFGLTGSDAGYFEIDASTGQIRTTQALDFETREETLTLTLYIVVTLHDGKGVVGGTDIVTDDDSVDDRKIFDITVTDVEEDGVVTLSSPEPEVGVQVEATLADGDGDVSGETWQWARSRDGQSRGTNISGATLSSYTPVDADRGFYLRASVNYTDRRGDDKSGEAFTTEQVFGANRSPTFPSTENGQRSIAENTAADQNVGAALTAIDADLDTLTYTLEGADAVFFNIDRVSGQIQTKGVTYDYEAKTSYAPTVRASDGTASATITVTITVTDENEPPDAPAAPSVTATSGSTTSLDVSWTAPTNTGRPAITNYDLRYRQGVTGNFLNGPQNVIGTSASIPGLAEGTGYEVQVLARNAEGDGSWSQSGTGTTNTPTGTPHITVSTTALTVTEEDTAGDSYTVVLDTQPTADVTVTVAVPAGTGVTPNPTTLTFTTSNWNTYHTVTVTAGNDADLTNDTVTLTHRAMSADTNYNGITIDDVTVTVNDNDTAQVTGVSVAAGNGQLVVSWTAVDNATGYKVQWKSGSEIYDTNRQATITSGSTTSHTIPNLTNGVAYEVRVIATRTGANDGLPSAEVPGTPAMPTTPGVTVSKTALTVEEEDTTGDSYTVVLDTQPTADVTVTVAGHAVTDVTPDPASLTFTTSNWSTAQEVTVTAAADEDTANDTVTLTHGAASADTNYNGITISDVTVTVNDNDTAAGICGRTDEVRDELLSLIENKEGAVVACADVTAAHLAAITGTLNLSGKNITALAAGDFAGLTALEILLLYNNALTTLPEDVFDGLTALMELDLYNTALTALTDDVFAGLTALKVLYLYNNDLTTLPDGVFDDLTSLETLDLSFNPEAPFAPDAVALPDAGTVPVTGGAVTLDGSGSGGPWGTNVTYGWALTTSTSGVTVTFDDDTSATPVVTIPELAADTELTFTLTVTGRGGTNGIATATDTAKVTARPTTPGVRVSKTDLTVTEEDTAGDSYTVVLGTQPTADVTVTVAGHSGTGVTPNPTTLTFTTSNWNTYQTVTVTAAADTDLTNDTVELTHSATSTDSAYNGITIAGVTVTVNDDDTGAVGICGRTPAVLNALVALIPDVSECAAVTDAHLAAITDTLKLSSQSIDALAAGDFAGLTELKTLNLFNNKLTALPDDVFDGLTALKTLHLDHNELTTLPDGVFDGLTELQVLYLNDNKLTTLPDGVFERLTALKFLYLGNNLLTTLPEDVFDGLTVLDLLYLNNNALTTLPDGVFEGLISLKGLRLVGNPEAPFAPIADARPDDGTVPVAGGAVTLDGSGSGGAWGTNVTYRWALTTTASGVTFDNATSATPVVTIPAQVENTKLIFTLTVTGRGGTNGIATATDTATVTARPTTPGVTVSKTALTVTEEDTTGDSYTVVLGTQPTADVVVMVAGHSGTGVTPNPATLTFTTSNWNTYQTVTVTAAADTDLTNDTVELTHSATSADSAYNGITIAGVAVTVSDNDTAQVMGVSVKAGNGQLAVRWTAVDNATGYKVQWKSGSEIYDTNRQATITSGSTTSHTIPNLTNGVAYEVRVIATRTGANDGLPSAEVPGTPAMPTTPGVTVLTTALTVTEEDTTGDSYTVVLGSQPTADVTVTVAGHSGTGVTPNPATLTFTTSNWNTYQTVTVTAAADTDLTNDTVELTHSATSTDSAYNGITIAGVTVTVNDNDTAQVMGVTVTAGNEHLVVSWTAVENATGYKVQWKSGSEIYDTNRQATITSGSTTSYTIPNLANGTVYTVRVIATRTGANDGLPSTELTGMPAMPTTAGVTVSKTALTVTEENTTGDSYTVILGTQPTADVTVTVAGYASTDVTPSPLTLTFTPTDWDMAQTVTVTAGNDADTVNDSVTLTHSATSGDTDYSGITIAGVTVTVEDDDTAVGLCGRTLAVHDALVALIPEVSDCADVTAAHLAAITGTLNLSGQNIIALAEGDFAGLTSLTQLKLNSNALTTLPEDVFDGLTSLAVLFLSNNELTTLPDGVFEPLTALQFLDLSGNPEAPFAPKAVALPDNGTVPVAGGAVTLDGSGSGGAWGTNVTYGWALTTSTSGVTVTFDDDASAAPVVTIPALAEGAELTFTLTVTGRGGSHSIDPATDTAKVTAALNTTNNPPVFDGGTAQTRILAETLGDRAVTTASDIGAAVSATDTDTGDTLTYSLEGTDAAFFDIDRTSGQIQTKAGVTYNHEARSSYSVTVRASDGTASATIEVAITVTDVDEPPDAPAAPLVTATSGSTTSLDVSWTAPTNTGRPAITNYDLRYRQGATGDFTNGPQNVTATGTSIPGLAEGTEYEVQVRASNDEGDGSWSQSGTGTTNRPTNTPGVTVSKTALTVTEEDTTGDSYTVVLGTRPTADVTVMVAGHAGTDVTPYPTSLTFTTLDWNTPQTVTVKAVNDADTANDTVTLTHSAASADSDYQGITIAGVAVTVNDNDDDTGAVGICGRTPAVRDALVALIPGVSDCAAVTTAQLAAITDTLKLSSQSIAELAAGDFAGLTELKTLNLFNNKLTALPDDVFDELTALKTLNLDHNELNTLPDGVFERLTALQVLYLNENKLTTLPDGVFDGLTALKFLYLGNNLLTTLPEDVFDELTVLDLLYLNNNELTTLPDGVFEGLISLKGLRLVGNPEAPFAPIADARPDDGTVPVAGGAVTLDGSGSGGAWGTNVTYRWALTTTASGVTFDNATSATPVVTIPELAADTELTFTLTVTGRGGTNGIAIATATATVTATAPTASGVATRSARTVNDGTSDLTLDPAFASGTFASMRRGWATLTTKDVRVWVVSDGGMTFGSGWHSGHDESGSTATRKQRPPLSSLLTLVCGEPLTPPTMKATSALACQGQPIIGSTL